MALNSIKLHFQIESWGVWSLEGSVGGYLSDQTFCYSSHCGKTSCWDCFLERSHMVEVLMVLEVSRILSIAFPGVRDAPIIHNYLFLVASWNKDELDRVKEGCYQTEWRKNETSWRIGKCSVMPITAMWRMPLWREGVNFIYVIRTIYLYT